MWVDQMGACTRKGLRRMTRRACKFVHANRARAAWDALNPTKTLTPMHRFEDLWRVVVAPECLALAERGPALVAAVKPCESRDGRTVHVELGDAIVSVRASRAGILIPDVAARALDPGADAVGGGGGLSWLI